LTYIFALLVLVYLR